MERRRGAAAHVAAQAAAAADAVHAAYREAVAVGRLRAEEAEAEAARRSALRARVEALFAERFRQCGAGDGDGGAVGGIGRDEHAALNRALQQALGGAEDDGRDDAAAVGGGPGGDGLSLAGFVGLEAGRVAPLLAEAAPAEAEAWLAQQAGLNALLGWGGWRMERTVARLAAENGDLRAAYSLLAGVGAGGGGGDGGAPRESVGAGRAGGGRGGGGVRGARPAGPVPG